MRFSISRFSLPLLLSVFILGACEGKPDQNAPKIDYWASIAPLMEAKYGGSCTNIVDGKVGTGVFDVSADGKIKTDDQRADFRKADELSLSREKHESGVVVTLSAEIDGTIVNVNTNSHFKDSSGSLKKGEAGVVCRTPIIALRLAAAKPHIIADSMLASAKKSFLCAPDGAGKPVSINYSYQNHILTVNKAVFDLNNIEQEQLFFREGYKAMSYHASGKNFRMVSVGFNQYGHITELGFPGSADLEEICHVI
jgi:hypothetical protein